MIRTLTTRRPTTPPMGVDIGATGVRAVQATRAKGRWRVVAAARSGRAGPDGDAGAAPDGVDVHLARGLRQGGFRKRDTAIALSPPDVEFHSLELPDAVLGGDADRATQVVRWEIERLMTHAETHVETRYWRLPSGPGSGANAIGVAADRGTVTRVTDACRAAGVSCRRVDTAATALTRLGALLGAWGRDEVWGTLDLGARQTRLMLCTDDVPVLVRVVGSGGQAWTKLLADSLDVTPKTAELQKREYGITGTVRGARRDDRRDRPGPRETRHAAPSDALASITYGVLRTELHALAAEVKRSYEYVLSCYPRCHAADLILVGGGAGMRNLPEWLASAAGVCMRRASDYMRGGSCALEYPETAGAPLESMAVAVGLALGP
ncbi:MAG: pilus assembly protein PilM [Phycisphaerae bacterium]